MKGLKELGVKNDGYKGLAIDWKVDEYYHNDVSFKMLKISTKNKRPNYIIFGKKKTDISAIPIIKE